MSIEPFTYVPDAQAELILGPDGYDALLALIAAERIADRGHVEASLRVSELGKTSRRSEMAEIERETLIPEIAERAERLRILRKHRGRCFVLLDEAAKHNRHFTTAAETPIPADADINLVQNEIENLRKELRKLRARPTTAEEVKQRLRERLQRTTTASVTGDGVPSFGFTPLSNNDARTYALPGDTLVGRDNRIVGALYALFPKEVEKHFCDRIDAAYPPGEPRDRIAERDLADRILELERLEVRLAYSRGTLPRPDVSALALLGLVYAHGATPTESGQTRVERAKSRLDWVA